MNERQPGVPGDWRQKQSWGLEWARDPDERREQMKKLEDTEPAPGGRRGSCPKWQPQLSAGAHPVPELCALKSPESCHFLLFVASATLGGSDP